MWFSTQSVARPYDLFMSRGGGPNMNHYPIAQYQIQSFKLNSSANENFITQGNQNYYKNAIKDSENSNRRFLYSYTTILLGYCLRRRLNKIKTHRNSK